MDNLLFFNLLADGVFKIQVYKSWVLENYEVLILLNLGFFFYILHSIEFLWVLKKQNWVEFFTHLCFPSKLEGYRSKTKSKIHHIDKNLQSLYSLIVDQLSVPSLSYNLWLYFLFSIFIKYLKTSFLMP